MGWEHTITDGAELYGAARPGVCSAGNSPGDRAARATVPSVVVCLYPEEALKQFTARAVVSWSD